jgi:hypothetical protein
MRKYQSPEWRVALAPQLKTSTGIKAKGEDRLSTN